LVEHPFAIATDLLALHPASAPGSLRQISVTMGAVRFTIARLALGLANLLNFSIEAWHI
jgi:hypothetical protein